MTTREFDLVIVGYGGAGASAAIEAHDASLRVCIVEKSSAGGGNTQQSGGSIRWIEDPDAAMRALRTYADSVTPDAVFEAFVQGVAPTVEWLRSLGAELIEPPAWTRGYPGANIQTLEGADRDGSLGGRLRVRSEEGLSGGEALWEVLRTATESRDIEVLYNTACTGLAVDHESGRVRGAVVSTPDGEREILADRAVVLTTGGFGADRDMQANFLGRSMLGMGLPDRNTGDGVRMAQEVGAGLWHMKSFATVMGYALPGFGQAIQHQMQDTHYIYVDGSGRRFINELGYDWHALPDEFLTTVGDVSVSPRTPAYVIFDEVARRAGPIINATTRAGRLLRWSADNTAEIDRGWIQSAATPGELAVKLGVDPVALASTIAAYNEGCAAGRDALGRDDPAPLVEPPYHGIAIEPILCNTQGGPVRNERAQVLDPFGSPIGSLYAAGELGSIWGKHYPGAGNVTEALVFGRIAGRQAALADN